MQWPNPSSDELPRYLNGDQVKNTIRDRKKDNDKTGFEFEKHDVSFTD